MSKENTKIPPAIYVMIPVSLYFFYQGYSRLSINDYFTGGFFLVAATVLLVSTYSVYKQHKKGN